MERDGVDSTVSTDVIQHLAALPPKLDAVTAFAWSLCRWECKLHVTYCSYAWMAFTAVCVLTSSIYTPFGEAIVIYWLWLNPWARIQNRLELLQLVAITRACVCPHKFKTAGWMVGFGWDYLFTSQVTSILGDHYIVMEDWCLWGGGGIVLEGSFNIVFLSKIEWCGFFGGEGGRWSKN